MANLIYHDFFSFFYAKNQYRTFIRRNRYYNYGDPNMVDNSLLGVISALRKVQARLYESHQSYLIVTETINNLEKYLEWSNDNKV